MLQHPPYVLYLANCDFYLFPKIKSALKKTPFSVGRSCERKTAEILNSLTEHVLQNSFHQLQHLTQLCASVEGNYFEGDRSRFLEFVKQKGLQAKSRFIFCVVPLTMLKRAVLYISLTHVSTLNNKIWILFVRNTDSKLQG